MGEAGAQSPGPVAGREVWARGRRRMHLDYDDNSDVSSSLSQRSAHVISGRTH